MEPKGTGRAGDTGGAEAGLGEAGAGSGANEARICLTGEGPPSVGATQCPASVALAAQEEVRRTP